MRGNNSFSTWEYLLTTYALSIAAWTIFMEEAFVSLLPSRISSLYLLLGLVLGSYVLGVILCYHAYRNFSSAAAAVLLPFELYALVSYWKKSPIFLSAVCIVTALLVILFSRFVMKQPHGVDEDEKRIRYLRRRHCVMCGRIIASVCLLTVFLVPHSLSGRKLPASEHASAQPPQYGPYGEAYTIKANRETIRLLDEDTWKTLNAEEKLQVLQTVANIETNYLGIPHRLTVERKEMETRIAGYYNDTWHTISISEDRLNNSTARDCLSTICHEAYHAYQHAVTGLLESADPEAAGLLFFRHAAKWRFEFENYKDAYEDEADFLAYQTQSVEEDAREYALDAVQDYWRRIYGD